MKHEEKHENSERWLLTYADLITLLMIFFVVMYSLSVLDAKKYQQMSDSLRKSFIGDKSLSITDISGGKMSFAKQQPESGKDVTANEDAVPEEYKLEMMEEDITNFLLENNMEKQVQTIMEERGLVIRMTDTLLFESGKAELKVNSLKKLARLGAILKPLNNYFRIEGHTDNVPIKTTIYQSNWSLSSARATTVTEFLIKYCGLKPDRIAAVGYGEYRPISRNDIEKGRFQNRRVDIVIVNNKVNKTENF